MLRKKCVFLLVAALTVTWLFSIDLFSQNASQPSRQAAMDSFTKGDYEKAYVEFSILLQNYPRDPLYKYYSGVCLVKLDREIENAQSLLREAVNESSGIRAVPDDAWFYLGRTQQISGKFGDAIKSYKVFTNNAGKKAARDLDVEKYIAECKAGDGNTNNNVKFGDLLADSAAERNHAVQPQNKVVQPHNEIVTEKPAAVVIDIPREKLPEDYDKRLSEALDYQVKADSLKTLASEYRKSYEQLPPEQKQTARLRIDNAETLSAKYQKLADERFGYQSEQNNKTREKKDTVPVKKEAELPSAPMQAADTQPAKNSKESGIVVKAPKEPVETTDIFSVFDIVPDQPAAKDKPVPVDAEIPSGLIYRIQMGVYTKPLTLSYFKGVTPIMGYKIAGSESVRYFAGLFRKISDANRALLRIKQAGFRESFLTASADGKQISTGRASVLEKEWGDKPLISVSRVGKAGKSVPATLIFRVEVTRSIFPLGDAATEAINRIAGERRLDIFYTDDGTFVYLIGKFITFDSASEYSNLLNRNGFHDAKVAGYLGNKEIPVDKARQLFEKAE